MTTEEKALTMNNKDDERLRKTTIAFLKDFAEQGYENAVECIDWLERQKSVSEIVERCKNSWYNEGKIAGMAEGLTNDEKYQQGWHDALEKQGEQKYTQRDIDDAYLKGIADVKREVEKQDKQTEKTKKEIAEFIFNSKEDIKHRHDWIKCLGFDIKFIEEEK